MEPKQNLINKAMYLTGDALCEFLSLELLSEPRRCFNCKWRHTSFKCICEHSNTFGRTLTSDSKQCNAWSVERLDINSPIFAFHARKTIAETGDVLPTIEAVMRVFYGTKNRQYNGEAYYQDQYSIYHKDQRKAYEWLALWAEPIHFAQILCVLGIISN